MVQDSQTIVNEDYCDKQMSAYKRLPENDDYNINLECGIGLITLVFLNNIKKDFLEFRNNYYGYVLDTLISKIGSGSLKKTTFNLDQKHLLCLSKVGLIKRQQHQLFCDSK